MVRLPDGEKIWKICLFILTEFTNVTDRHTDRHRMTARATLMHSITQQKLHSLCYTMVKCAWSYIH